MNLPSSFIYFDQISELGSFRNCVLDFCPEHGEFGSYSYMINVSGSGAKNKVSLTVRIRPLSDRVSSENIIGKTAVNSNDLRNLKTDASGVYTIGGVSLEESLKRLILFQTEYLYLSFSPDGERGKKLR